MICKYLYRLVGESEYHGWFQCDTKDLKTFLRHMKNSILFIEVVFANGEVYVALPEIINKEDKLLSKLCWHKIFDNIFLEN